MNDEILNEEMMIEFCDDRSQRENVTRNILSNNIKFVSVCNHLDPGTKKYRIRIRTREQGMES